MSDIALDPTTGDLLIEDDALSLIEEDDAIAQHLTIRFQFVFREWFLDTRLGIPYFGEILIKNPDLTRVRGIFRQVILTTPGIAALETFNMVFDNAARKLSVDFRAQKTDGTLLVFDREFIIE